MSLFLWVKYNQRNVRSGVYKELKKSKLSTKISTRQSGEGNRQFVLIEPLFWRSTHSFSGVNTAFLAFHSFVPLIRSLAPTQCAFGFQPRHAGHGATSTFRTPKSHDQRPLQRCSARLAPCSWLA